MDRRFKNIILFLLIICISTSLAGMSQPAIAAGTFITTDRVRLRTEPSTDSTVIIVLDDGASVEVLDHDPAGWSKVQVGSSSGFIRSDFLKFPIGDTPATFRTTKGVNLRFAATTDSDVLNTVPANTSVEVSEHDPAGWSKVNVEGISGFIRSDFLTRGGSGESRNAAPNVPDKVIATLRTVTGARLRTGPSTNDSIIEVLPVNTSVDILENLTNGWSRVRFKGTEGFIRSDLLGTGTSSVELIDWATAKNIVSTGVNIRVVDVRSGITFTIRGFAKTEHLDVEPVTKDDTDAILRSRNGVWGWAPHPVWVTVGDRTFAAALNGMPHDVSNIRDNGMDGHLCLHFNNTVTNSQSYQRDLNNAVMEAYNARPR